MSDYLGRIITKNPTYPSPTAASGVWTLDEAMQYQKAGKWPPGYAISRSVRLRSAASASFSRTPASASNQKTWTWSGWVKRGSIADSGIFSAGTSSTNYFNIRFQPDYISVVSENSSLVIELRTTPLYRDPSAWYHIVFALDTTQATSTDRAKLYVNGVQVTAFSTTTYPSLNLDMVVNSAVVHYNGRIANSGIYFDGYLTEINFIDGQALTPTSFGYADTATGVWQPLPYTGTYGTNGFYLNFKDPTSTTTIGYDYSGNSNNWTANNISVTSGTTYDSMVDSPSSYGTDRGNYCVWNPNFRFSYSGGFAGTFSNGNLQVATGGNPSQFAGSMALPDGAYFEVTPSSIDVNRTYVGLFAVSRSNLVTSTTNVAYGGTYNVLYSNDGNIYVNTTSGSTIFGAFSTYTNSDVISVAYKSGKIYFAKNNVWQNSGVPASGTGYVATGWDAYGDLLPYCGYNSTFTGNFGQQPFTYTPPTGFIGVCTQNLSVPTINNGANYMAATLYTGNGATQSINNSVNNVSFQPDLVWIKSRSATTDNKLTDSVRGATKALISNSTAAETTDTNGLTAFGSTGFTVSTDTVYNNNAATYVGWQWKANGAGSSNTSGSITSTVSVNTTAGFSVVTYTGTGANATIGHGLGVAPQMVIIKNRSGANGWTTYHAFQNASPASGYVQLNSTAAFTTFSLVFNNTAPTSSVFSVGTDTSTNASTNNYVAYCFAPIAGYSAFGSYTGNGSADGPFVYLGFRPRFVITKSYDATAGVGDWTIHDTSRLPYNTNDLRLFANSSSAESTSEAMDMLSNGFKIRATNSNCNTSGGGYIYAAFAENPFKYARAR